jgi:hypothetical protein
MNRGLRLTIEKVIGNLQRRSEMKTLKFTVLFFAAVLISCVFTACKSEGVDHGGFKSSSVNYVDSTDIYVVQTECNDGTTGMGSYKNEEDALDRVLDEMHNCNGE